MEVKGTEQSSWIPSSTHREMPGEKVARASIPQTLQKLFNKFCMIYLFFFWYLSLITNPSIMTNCFVIHALE